MVATLWKTLAVLVAALLQLSYAQQYLGDTIPNALPGVPGSELVYFRIKDPAGKATNLTLTNYYSLQLSGSRVDPSQLQRAVIIIHGLNRDPGTYMSNMLSALSQLTTDSNVNRSSVAIMAPYFPNGDDKQNASTPQWGYPWSNVSPAGKKLSGGKQSYSNALVWKGSAWSAAGMNQYPDAYQNTSSYDVLDQLVQYFGNKSLFPQMKQIVVAGHSLGGQTVQRYAAVGKTSNTLGVTTPVSLWIANPNSLVWLNSSRPLPTSGCSSYDDWRGGLSNYQAYPTVYNTDLVNQGSAAVIANYEAKTKAYARGLQDMGDDSGSDCSPFTSGANRNERFFNFINWFPATCEAPTSATGHCDTIDLVNAGHDAGVMMASSAGLARLFTDNFYGDGARSYDFGYPRQEASDDPYPNPAYNDTTSANATTYAGNMTSQGCYTDSSARTLTTLAYDSTSNTIEKCTTTCNSQGYLIAGLEFGSQCWCGNTIGASAAKAIDAGCGQACAGNSSEVCGGSNRLSIYSNGTPTQAQLPGTPETVGNYFYQGCYTEATSGRALSATSYSDGSKMTLESCAAFCNGYEYFGVEYASECYCGSYFGTGSAVTSDSSCNMVCSGNSLEYCGGGGTLTVFQLEAGAPVSTKAQGSTTTAAGSTTASGSTTVAGSTKTGTTSSTSTSGIPSASLCPSVDGQGITDSNNNTYTMHCSSDSTQGSYTNAQAASSYLDCMTACDSASSSGCTGWTYVGGAYGSGSGACYLKTAMGSYTSAGTNYISGVLSSNGASGSSSSSSSSSSSTSVGTSSTTGASTTSSASSAASTNLCPAANGKTITDSNGNNYTVTCSSDNNVGSYTNAQASTSYVDCMAACDAASSSGCQGFTYVGAAYGSGAGTCWLKSSMGTYTSAGNNYISAAKVSSGSSSSSSSISSISASSSSVSGTPTSASSTSSASSTASASLCPSANGQTITDSKGNSYQVTCSSDNNVGSYTNTQASASYLDCMVACDSASGCQGFTYVGGAYGSGSGTCWLKRSMGTYTSAGNNYISAVKVSSGSSSSSSSSLISSSSSTSSPSSSSLSSTSSVSSSSLASSVSSGLVSSSGVSSSMPSDSSSISSSMSSISSSSSSVSSSSSSVSSSSSSVSSVSSSSSSVSSSVPSDSSSIPSSMSSISSSSSSVSSSSSSVSSSSSSVASSSSSVASSSSSVSSVSSSSSSISSSSASSSLSSSSVSSSPSVSPSASPSSSLSSSTVSSTSSSLSSSSAISSSTSAAPTTFATSTSSSTTSKSSTSSGVTLPSGFSPVGCFVDGSPRALTYSNGSSSTQTPSQCALNCRALGYKYSGTEYGSECWCSDLAPMNNATSTDCNMACSGDKTQTCGAGNRLSVVVDNNWTQTFFARSNYSTWNLMACYTDNTNGRLLANGMSTTGGASNMTIANCLDACTKSGLKYCGAEYYSECFGGNTQPSSTLVAGSDPLGAGCNYACKGNSTEACGGSNKILIYINNGTAS